jgi:hypothetical protein
MTIEDTQLKWQPFARSESIQQLSELGYAIIVVDRDYKVWNSYIGVPQDDDRYYFRIKLKNKCG